jgi:hypothetical protein
VVQILSTILSCLLLDLLVDSDCIDGAFVIELGDVPILIPDEILGTENVPRVTWQHVELAVRPFIEYLHVGFDKLDEGFSVDIFLQVVRWLFFSCRDIQITRIRENQVQFLEFDPFILAKQTKETIRFVCCMRRR